MRIRYLYNGQRSPETNATINRVYCSRLLLLYLVYVEILNGQF